MRSLPSVKTVLDPLDLAKKLIETATKIPVGPHGFYVRRAHADARIPYAVEPYLPKNRHVVELFESDSYCGLVIGRYSIDVDPSVIADDIQTDLTEEISTRDMIREVVRRCNYYREKRQRRVWVLFGVGKGSPTQAFKVCDRRSYERLAYIAREPWREVVHYDLVNLGDQLAKSVHDDIYAWIKANKQRLDRIGIKFLR